MNIAVFKTFIMKTLMIMLISCLMVGHAKPQVKDTVVKSTVPKDIQLFKNIEVKTKQLKKEVYTSTIGYVIIN